MSEKRKENMTSAQYQHEIETRDRHIAERRVSNELYAKKEVEKIVYGAIWIVLSSVVIAVLGLIIIK